MKKPLINLLSSLGINAGTRLFVPSRILIFIWVLFLTGCILDEYAYRHRTKIPYVFPAMTLSPDDKQLIFAIESGDTSKTHPNNYKICSFNLNNDSLIVLLNSDSVLFFAPFYSRDGQKLIYVSKSRHYSINYYDINSKQTHEIFHSFYPIYRAVISPRNEKVYFVSESNLIDKKYKEKWEYCPRNSIFSINIDGSGLMQVNSLDGVVGLEIDKNGENLLFNNSISSDINGPFELNIGTSKIVALTPKNMLDFYPKRNPIYAKSNGNGLDPIPSLFDSTIFLRGAFTIYKYDTTSKRATLLYEQSKKEIHKSFEIYLPAVFHHSNKLIAIKDTADGEQNFVIIDSIGHIIRTFRPAILKYPEHNK